MKKYLLVLGMIFCLLGLTACGSSKEVEETYLADADAEGLATQFASLLDEVTAQQAVDQYIESVKAQGVDTAVFTSAFESWGSAVEIMGSYDGFKELTENTLSEDFQNGTVEAVLSGSEHDAKLEIVIEDSMPTSISVNPIYTFGESMEKAALNTLLGMGTVFTVLILISLIISSFTLISKAQNKKGSKSSKEELTKTAVDHTIAQIIEKEELSDDLELVAVISAAIAASEGASSTDGFVVRSIRRAGNKWQRA